MLNEAIKRMNVLNLYKNGDESLMKYLRDDIIFLSIPVDMLGHKVGSLYRLTDAERELVKGIETEHNVLVYHVIRNVTEIGVMYSILFVSSDDECLESDSKDVCNDPANVISYVVNTGYSERDSENLKDCDFVDCGYITIKRAYGGLIRIA